MKKFSVGEKEEKVLARLEKKMTEKQKMLYATLIREAGLAIIEEAENIVQSANPIKEIHISFTVGENSLKEVPMINVSKDFYPQGGLKAIEDYILQKE